MFLQHLKLELSQVFIAFCTEMKRFVPNTIHCITKERERSRQEYKIHCFSRKALGSIPVGNLTFLEGISKTSPTI